MNLDVAGKPWRLPRIVVNATYRLAPDADMLVAHDIHWWQRNPQVFGEFAGLKVCGQTGPEDILSLRDTGEDGFDERLDCVRGGGNSGHMAVHIAAHAGAKIILLFGFDMTPGHWHHERLRDRRPTADSTYPIWAARLEAMAGLLFERGVEVVCCTPSALRLPQVML